MLHVRPATFGAILVAICNLGFAEPRGTGCVGTFDANRDYFTQKAEISDAQLFAVSYHGYYKILSVRLRQDDPRPLRHLLVLCGAPRPAVDGVTATVTIPVQSVVALSNAYLPFLESSGAIDRLIAVNQHTHVSSPAVRAAIDKGRVAEIGREATLDRERLIALRPDLVLTYGDGDVPQALKPVRQLGVPIVVTAEFREISPLAYAEWVKFVAAFFNTESSASTEYESIRSRYLELRARARTARNTPTVMAGGGYHGTWYVPAPASYTARLIEDAGGRYAFSSLPWRVAGTDTMPAIDLETALAHGQHAAYWIDTSIWRSREEAEAQEPRLVLFDAFKAGQLYNNDAQTNPAGANAYWEQGLAHPDTVLEDLIIILHPDIAPGNADGSPLKWYRRLPATRP